MFRAVRHRFELRSNRYFSLVGYNLLCSVSDQSDVLSISPHHRSKAFDDGKDKGKKKPFNKLNISATGVI